MVIAPHHRDSHSRITSLPVTGYRLPGKVPLKFTYPVNRIVYRRLIRTDATNVQMQRYVRGM